MPIIVIPFAAALSAVFDVATDDWNAVIKAAPNPNEVTAVLMYAMVAVSGAVFVPVMVKLAATPPSPDK